MKFLNFKLGTKIIHICALQDLLKNVNRIVKIINTAVIVWNGKRFFKKKIEALWSFDFTNFLKLLQHWLFYLCIPWNPFFWLQTLYYLVNHQMSSNFEKILINQVRLGFFPLKCFTWKIFLKDSISFNLPTWMIVWLFVYEFEFPKLGASIFNGFSNFMVIYLLIMCRNFQLSNKKTHLYLLWRQEFSQILCCFHTNIQVDHLLF